MNSNVFASRHNTLRAAVSKACDEEQASISQSVITGKAWAQDDRSQSTSCYFACWYAACSWQGSIAAYSQAAEAENEDVNGVCLLLAAIWELVIVQRASAHFDKAR